uniref:ER membrane protein complex subunit 4 n=1 Tax=Strigamia maritima TaxID=126957 RepID=T1J4X3_STRMM
MASSNRTISKRPKWAIDFSSRGKSEKTSDLPSPPGFHSSQGQTQVESAKETDPHLIVKKSWDIALGPLKQVPMNLFIMYMAGNSISIFPIMMVGMLFLRPVKALLSFQATFKMIEGSHAMGQKFVYLLGNIACLALALYKCQSMGLLPTHASDWLAFATPQQRMEYSGERPHTAYRPHACTSSPQATAQLWDGRTDRIAFLFLEKIGGILADFHLSQRILAIFRDYQSVIQILELATLHGNETKMTVSSGGVLRFLMPTITLHFFHASPPSRNVLLTLKALNLEATMIEVDFFGKQEHLQPDFLKLNPAHTLPTLLDGKICLWESRSIMRYLVSMYPNKKYNLYPTSLKERAHVDKMLDFDLGTLYRSIEIYFEVYMFTETEPDQNKLTKVKHNIKIFEEILKKNAYAAGNKLTIADISLSVTMTTIDALLIDYSECQHINKWMKKIKSELPFFDEVNLKGWQEFKDYFDDKKKRFE